MKGILKKSLLTIAFLGVLFLAGPSQADTSWSVSLGTGDRNFHHHDRSHYWPHGYRPINFHNHRYYYYNGIYYSGSPENYVIVNPPVGVIVSTIPSGYRQTWINGRVYYEYNGTYYAPGLAGYQVVEAPPTTVLQSPAINASVPAVPTNVTVSAQEDLTINIPNSYGGFTPVVLKKSGAGYTGPQGEYYSEFPKVAQLKAMYVK